MVQEVNLFIFNSEKRHSPVLFALLLAGVASGLVGWVRSPEKYAYAPQWFWLMKSEWQNEADIILAGDSRVYRGLDPVQFSELLQKDCVNFGFSGVGFEKTYLDAIERVVRKDSSMKPTVVLGVTAWSLTDAAVRNNGFLATEAQARSSLFTARTHFRFEKMIHAFRPMDISALWRGKNHRRFADERALKEQYMQVFHSTGWVSSDYRHREPRRGVGISESDHSNNNTVSYALLHNLASRIRMWKKENWNVYAFRPPVPLNTSEVADELGAYDESLIAQILNESGAVSININPDLYQTNDGSHLVANDAQKLSRELANIIKDSSSL